MEEQKKKKHAFWLSPECKGKIEQLYQQDNCKSQSEFVENAVRFYAGYLGVKDASEYLAPVLSQVLHGSLDSFAAHVNRNLFRLSVEEAKTWNIIAGMFRVSAEQLQNVHGKAVGEVKRIGDKLTYEKIYEDPLPLEYSLDIFTGEDE